MSQAEVIIALLTIVMKSTILLRVNRRELAIASVGKFKPVLGTTERMNKR